MDKATFRYIQDPGHGWLQVPRRLVHELGIEAEITRYSYVDEHNAYLEEDCDMPRFLRAFDEEMSDVDLVIEHAHSNDESFVRDLYTFQPLVFVRAVQ